MTEFAPVTSNKLYIQIYNQILAAIEEGRYKVGDKLPTEKELCQAFNASRVPVREALSALELNGLIDSMQGLGAYVKRSRPLSIRDLSQIEPQDIIFTRTIIEPHIAREAALHLDATSRRDLGYLMAQFQDKFESGSMVDDTDRKFHLCIAKASGNTMLLMIMEAIFSAMDQDMWSLILSRTISTDKYKEQNVVEHVAIGQAILDGRADEAYSLMNHHMKLLYERFWS